MTNTNPFYINIKSISYPVFLGLLGLCTLLTCTDNKKEISIFSTMEHPQIEFGLSELNAALTTKGWTIKTSDQANADIIFEVDETNPQLKSEGFEIKKEGNVIRLTGYDPAGLLYGAIELAEQVTSKGLAKIEPALQNPYMEMRGTKFNIPLDVRTPSYTDASDVAQNNIPVMWDFDFWQDYIDNLARYRYNYISLWNLHPFPSMVKVPGYSEVALDDVQRSTVDWKENYHLHGTGLDEPEILANPEIVKEISIEEKIEFWKKVMQYAQDRNVDFYVITWNIFTYGTEGKYGITDQIDNEITKDYFKQSIKAMFKTYPLLDGIGLTTGENMHRKSFEEKEGWAYDTYAKAILEVAEEMPDRQFTFIHRQHQTGAKNIAEKFKPVIDAPNIEFLYCFKYAKAHVFSTTEQHYHQGFVKDIEGMKTIWGLRNDDTYFLRWGAPDFVRAFIQNIPTSVAKGIYYGSDQWIWGREFLTKNPETPKQLEIVKHWYNWALWGRLSYDASLSNQTFVDLLKIKFPNTNAQLLMDTWQEASMIYPTTTAFHWGEVDFKWYIEACKSRPGPAQNKTGFHDVNRFITLPPHPKSGFQSIPDYVAMQQTSGTTDLKTPLAVAEKLRKHANAALSGLEQIDPSDSKELAYTLNDIKSMAFLGKYYAHKIEGATHLALYRETKMETEQTKAIESLNQALSFWGKYAEAVQAQNKTPLWTNRVGYVDFQQLEAWAAEDIEIARETL
ncbi:MAG: hypothetical protein Sapg2KO_23760 [Saprospiraceae bacterium]